MYESDTQRLQPSDLGRALALMTRIPVRSDGKRAAQAAWAWPIAGAAVALLAVFSGWVLLLFNVPVPLVAALVLALQVILTGAMHEDGLADCADGFWGGQTGERRLEIMRDSRIGTYGVLAMVLALLLRWSAVTALIAADWLLGGLVAAAALSRVPMVAMMHYMPQARADGLSRHVGVPSQDTLTLAAVVAAVLALLFAGFAALPAMLVGAAVAWGLGKLAMERVDGQTGDVLGASQQLCEVAILVTLTSILT